MFKFLMLLPYINPLGAAVWIFFVTRRGSFSTKISRIRFCFQPKLKLDQTMTNYTSLERGKNAESIGTKYVFLPLQVRCQLFIRYLL